MIIIPHSVKIYYSSEEEDRLAEAAVTYDSIMKESRLSHDTETRDTNDSAECKDSEQGKRKCEDQCDNKGNHLTNTDVQLSKMNKSHKPKKKKKRESTPLKVDNWSICIVF